MNAAVQTIEPRPARSDIATVHQTQSQDSNVLMMIVQKMSEDPDFDIDKVTRLIEIKERLDAAAAKKAYAADMAEFKKVAPTILKDRHVSFKTKEGNTSYSHASLGNVVETAIAKLAEFGFSHRWTAPREGDRIVVTCTLTHRLGHSESETQDGGPDTTGSKSNLQAAASTRTFLERYTFLAVAGLATKEMADDDGRAGGGEPEETLEQADAKRAAQAREQSWLDAFDGAGDVPALEKLQRELIDACGGRDKVPEKLKGAYVARKKALAK